MDGNEIWPGLLPDDPLMRRIILWRALAVLAACDQITLDRILICLVMDTFKPPTDDELTTILTQAREAGVAQKATR